MAATVKTYQTSKILRGTADVWINAGLPASGSPPGRPVLTGGTPDSVTNPTPPLICLGGTVNGAKFNYSYETEEEKINQMPSAYRRAVKNEAASVEIDYLEVLDLPHLAQLMPTGKLQTQTGFSQITGGGGLILSAVTVLVIAKNPNAAGKYLYIMLYAAMNTAPIQLAMDANARAVVPVRFDALGLPTRSEYDQLFQIDLDD